MDLVKEVQARMFPMDNAETLAEEVPEDRPEDPETPVSYTHLTLPTTPYV